MSDELLYTQEDIDEWMRTCDELQEKIYEQMDKIKQLSKQLDDRCDRCIERERKETAEKFAERLKDLVAERNCNDDYDWEDVQVDGQIFIECIDEICKEITEGK